MLDRSAVIAELWKRIGSQDFEGAAEFLHPEVDWQDLIFEGRRSGPQAVIDYWRELHTIIRPKSDLIDITEEPGDVLTVRMRHAVFRTSGELWSDETVVQRFQFKDGLIIRMDAA